MLTGELRSQIDRVWDAFWSGGIANPLEVSSILRQCRAAKVPFFFKQWGGVRKDLTGRALNGRLYDEMPRGLQTA